MTRMERLKRREQERKEKRKELIKNIIGVAIFYLAIIGGCLLIEDRYNDLCKQGYKQYCSVEE